MRYLFVLVAVVLSAGSAMSSATTTLFLDTTDSLSVTQNGTPLPLCSATSTIEECAGIIGVAGTGLTITGGLGNFNIFEDASLTTLSDTLSLTQLANGDLEFVFLSDVEGTFLTPLPNATSLVENGSVQTASTVTFSNGGSNDFDFQSDAPEPSSLLLLGTGVLGLARIARRKLLG